MNDKLRHTYSGPLACNGSLPFDGDVLSPKVCPAFKES